MSCSKPRIPALMDIRISPDQWQRISSWQRGREAPRVDHLTRQLGVALKMLHHLHQIGSSSQTSKLPRGFQQLSTTIIRQLRPAQPSGAIQAKFRATTDQYLHSINAVMRDHYKEILLTTSKELARIQPSNTTLQKAAQIALSWHRAQSQKKLDPKTVHIFREWTRAATTTTTRDHLDDLLTQGPRGHHPVGRNQPAPPPAPTTTRNRFACLATEDTPADQPTPTTSTTTRQTRKTPSKKTPTRTHPPPTNLPPAAEPTTVNAKGAKDPLSNFYMAPLEFQGSKYASSEHAYQTVKARFHGMPSLGEDIKAAPSGREAKALTYFLKRHPRAAAWDAKKEEVMRDILQAKLQQCPIFKRTLQETEGATITHKVPDSFWGTTCHNSQGKLVIGRDIFSTLLMELRATIMPAKPRAPPHRPKTPPPRSKTPPPQPSYAQILTQTPTKRPRATSPPTTATPTKKLRSLENFPPLPAMPATPTKRSRSTTPPATEYLHITSTPKKLRTASPRSPTPPRQPTHQMSPASPNTPPRFQHIPADDSLSLILEESFPTHQEGPQDITLTQTPPTTEADQSSGDIAEEELDRIHTRPDQSIDTLVKDFMAPKTHSSRIVDATGSISHIIRKGQDITFQRETVLVGDSNLKHIHSSPKGNPVQIISYSGASISSLQRQYMTHLTPSAVPRNVILSIGINNDRPTTPTQITTEFRKLASRAKRTFPEATIWIPMLNHTKDLPSYRVINDVLTRDPPKDVQVIPALPPQLYQTQKKDKHHWTIETANRLLEHWMRHLPAPRLTTSTEPPP